MQTLDIFIGEQVKIGVVHSEIEAEKMILQAVSQRTLDRKLARAQEQVRNGDFYEANDDFIDDLLSEGKKSISATNL